MRRDANGDAGGDGGPNPGALKRFKFRGTQALYANRMVSLCLNDDGTKAEARNHQGQQAMTAISGEGLG